MREKFKISENCHRIEVEELKKIQLEILKNVADFCEKNQITYFLQYGTLIGAIRHKGYIPWDDDIDIGMLRPDYEKFLATYNLSSDRYKVRDVSNSEQHMWAFSKVVDTNTILYEPDEHGVKSAVYIDVFVFDNASEDDKKRYKKFMYSRRMTSLNNIRARLWFSESGSFKKFIKKLIYPFLLVVPKNYFVKKIVKNAKKDTQIQTSLVGDFCERNPKLFYEREQFSETFKVEFEGEFFNVPKGYDGWLRKIYGDYMQLPPEKDRVSHHSYIAFYLDN